MGNSFVLFFFQCEFASLQKRAIESYKYIIISGCINTDKI